MRPEKKFVANEYVARLNASPYFIAVDYTGLTVLQFTELRKRLTKAGAEIHVVKNSIFRVAVKEAGIGDLAGGLAGQVAVVSGPKDVSLAAKVMKTYQKEFERPKIKFGYLNNSRLEAADIVALAELPPIEALRSKLLGLLTTSATSLVRLLNTPGTQLARVLQARVEKGA